MGSPHPSIPDTMKHGGALRAMETEAVGCSSN